MGTLDSIKAILGEDLGEPEPRDTTDRGRHNWQELCVCGHLGRWHAPVVGGSFEFRLTETRFRGETVRVIHQFEGCQGAMPSRNFETETMTADHDKMTLTVVHNCTCPCTEFRPVVRVDRPNRFFNQRVHPDRHPFAVGVRAFTKHLSKRKGALEDETGTWVGLEFDRRFVWIPEAQKCSISNCKVKGEDCFPAYVNDDRHSEMRCGKHR